MAYKIFFVSFLIILALFLFVDMASIANCIKNIDLLKKEQKERCKKLIRSVWNEIFNWYRATKAKISYWIPQIYCKENSVVIQCADWMKPEPAWKIWLKKLDLKNLCNVPVADCFYPQQEKPSIWDVTKKYYRKFMAISDKTTRRIKEILANVYDYVKIFWTYEEEAELDKCRHQLPLLLADDKCLKAICPESNSRVVVTLYLKEKIRFIIYLFGLVTSFLLVVAIHVLMMAEQEFS
ncbi:uncharacterized protein [Centruroides vittatus]|uniref:uncharacterized protein n=1 Tax=Centruroides vittatus TaxID=120091 RepID=UPI00350EA576